MKADLKAQWIAALRSGRYRQCRNFLHVDDAYCCLGVLCRVHGWPVGNAAGDVDESPEYAPIKKLLGPEVMETLVALNDTDGQSFAQIADWIEANL